MNSRRFEVLVIGMGAVGTMAAYAIDTGQQANVTAVLRSNYDIVTRQGFTIDSIDHGKITGWRPHRLLDSVPDVNDKNHRYDFIVLATKNTPDVGPNLPDLIAPALTAGHTCIVLMQNGLNIEKPFQQRFPTNQILSVVQLIGTEETSPGHIHHNEPDISYIGWFDVYAATSVVETSGASNLEIFRDLYADCGRVKCEIEVDARVTRWRKLIYNASYNSVAAITGLDVTRMRIHEHVIDNLIKPIMREIITIAAAEGVVIAKPPKTPEELIHEVITIDKLSSWFMPSMGQDAAKNNYLEFENIVGEPVRVAQKLGVEVPTLTTVYGILKGIQEKIRETREAIVPSIEMAGRYK